MALINCVECGRQISDTSKQCIHCGYMIEKVENENNEYLFNGLNLLELYDTYRGKKVTFVKYVVDNAVPSVGLKEAKDAVDKFVKSVESEKNTKVYSEKPAYGNQMSNNDNYCPICKSTEVKKIVFELFNSGKNFKCKRCTHKW